MRIEIDIPKEFEEHFKQDKFKDSFERIMADLKNSLCAGRYEYETIEMLEKALENSESAYSVDKVVKELNKLDVKAIKRYKGGTFGDYEGTDYYIKKSEAIEIVKQGGVGTETETIRDKAVKWNNNSSKRVPYEFIDYVEGKRGINISDDACEWRLCDEEANVYDTSCRNPHILIEGTPQENNYEYCPYCGKKIKVV